MVYSGLALFYENNLKKRSNDLDNDDSFLFLERFSYFDEISLA